MRGTEESPLLRNGPERASSPRLSVTRQMLIVGAMACAGLLNIFTVQSTVIVLPAIQESLNIPVSRQQLITSMYSISSGCLLLLCGRLADVHGRKRVFLTGAACFTASSIATPFAPNEVVFYALRVLQGFSNAATVPSALGILATLFPQGSNQRKWAFVTFSAASSLGSVVGNLVGGFIGAYLSWHWVFWIPAGIAALVGVLACGIVPPVVPPSSPTQQPDEPVLGAGPKHCEAPPSQSVDWIGGMLITANMLSLLLALSYATVLWGRSPLALLGLVTLSAGLAGAFVLWQRRLESGTFRWAPLIRTSMFLNTDFSVSLIVITSFCGSYNSFLVFASVLYVFFSAFPIVFVRVGEQREVSANPQLLYWTISSYQDYLGLDTLQTTLRFIPAGVVGRKFLVSQSTPRVVTEFFQWPVLGCFALPPILAVSPSPFYVVVVGLVCGIVTPLLYALPAIPPDASYWAWGFPAMCLCFSVDIVWPIVGLVVSRSVPDEEQALAGGALQTSSLIGRAMGLAVAAAVQVGVLQQQQQQQGPEQPLLGDLRLLRSLRAAQWTNVGLALLALLLVLGFFRKLGHV
ncbi:MFS general substrate transporter [Apiospora rasikravindrae]|uniref:MFS general substrate transporter n=1 Tax=Apiospora rasikravindrae TaxID=990691 RepID=A0ABR1RX22_9PEZI